MLLCGQAYAQEGLLLYVPLASGADSVAVFRTNTNGTLTSVATITGVGSNAFWAAVRGDQAFAYVTYANLDQVKVIDTRTNTVVQTAGTGDTPRGVAVSPDGRLVYVTNNSADSVSVFSAGLMTGQLTAVTTIATGANTRPRHVAFSPDGSRAYILNRGNAAGSVHVVDTATHTIVATVATGGQLSAMAINADGTRLYATDINGNQVFVIDVAAETAIASPPTGNFALGVAASPDGAFFYVTSNNDHDIRQYDGTTGVQVGGPVDAHFNPRALAFSPDGHFAYVAHQGTDDHVRVFAVTPGTGVLVNNGTPAAAGTDPESVGLCRDGSAMLRSGATFVANTGAALGCAGSNAAFTGGTLLVNDTGLTFSTPITLGAGGGTIDTNGNDAAFSGTFGGANGLSKTGGGTAVLSGVNTYTGVTNVGAGTMLVNGSLASGSTVVQVAPRLVAVGRSMATSSSGAAAPCCRDSLSPDLSRSKGSYPNPSSRR